VEELGLDWRSVESLEDLSGCFSELGFDVFFEVLVLFCLVVGFLVEVLEDGVELSWEGESQVPHVLSEPHVHTLIDSAEFFQPFGGVVIDL